MFRYTSTDVNYLLENLERELSRIGGEIHHYSTNPTGRERIWYIDIHMPLAGKLYIIAHGSGEAYDLLRAVRWGLDAGQTVVSDKDSQP